MRAHTTKIVLGMITCALAAGCADKKPMMKAKTPIDSAFKSHWDDPANGAAKADQGATAPGLDTPGLHVSDEIARLCGLTATTYAPKFDFDATTLADEDRTLLTALAHCLSDGALKGRHVALVGRTDPRGEAEYNMSLGESRADSVRRYLHDMGVGLERVAASSRGEIDATGTEETSWALDRRVDIALAE